MDLVSIVKATHEVRATEDGVVEVESIDDLVDELPDNTPRYVLVSYHLTHDDGRQASPLFLVYWIPRTASTELSTLYVRFPTHTKKKRLVLTGDKASAKVWFTEKCDVSKVLEIRDADDLTTEYIEERLKGSK